MNFIVSSTSLLKALQAVGGVLNSSNTLPILDNFLFEIGKNTLSIAASDLESTMSTQIEVQSKDEGSVAVPAKLLLDILKTFPDHPLTFSINDKLGIEISSDYGKYSLSGYNAEEFPKVPVLEKPSSVTVPTNTLQKAIEKTLFAAGNDDLRPVMSGVFCQMDSSNITFVATDAHKLVRYRRVDLKTDSAASFIIPRKPMNLLKGLLGNIEGDVNLEYNESNAQFKFGNFTLICRLIDGKYPNYEAVIPSDNPNRMTIGKSQFSSSLKRVSIFANKTTHQVRLKISGSQLIISAEDLDFANAAKEELTCAYEGEDIEIGFNSRFLMEMVNNVDSESLVLELSAPNRAGILLPENSEDEGEDILMLVMPVMLNS
ncbi:DNA polymerase III subunit beta [Parvicella tangerina]|uniref:Beta sliding clamp n=1 Tax=Parvicella tangerina TaxID=2829795 RepID=A0A916JKU1_9FLAO|nr:DNA polymerase III subunit beta [Parvicella tangerina]CAG5079869.1 Beta sliding clamp [Parvicella tangerina]